MLRLARGEWSISGFRAADLRDSAPGLTPGRVREFEYTYSRGRPTPPKAAESGKYIVVV